MKSAKPFEISKRTVMEAYRRVKSNQGAAGIDRVSLEQFDQDLSRNLYRIWNRMSSGSYFPPPVRTVMIPKPGGWAFQRFPIESRRWWSNSIWSHFSNLAFTRIPMAIGRENRRSRRWLLLGSVAGSTIGWSNSTSKARSTIWITNC